MLISPKRRQHGSMLVVALFVIIVVSLLGITLVTTLTSTSQALTYDVSGTRAYQAAQSGLEQVKASALMQGSEPAACAGSQSSPPALSSVEGLINCQYTTQCTTTDVDKDGTPYRYYRFSSRGTCRFGGRWTSRIVHADAWVAR